MKLPESVQVILYREAKLRREYLVLLRRLAGSPDFWQPVSGSLEPGESWAQAARREVAEETGLVELDDFREIGLVNRFEIAPAWRPKYEPGILDNTQVAFAARVDSGDVALDSVEHAEARWEPYETARSLFYYADNRRALDLVELGEERAVRRRFEWAVARRTLALGERTLVMGILNVTPDSFSDGGRFASVASAVERALEIEAEGADILDVGGESSRPGSEPVGDAEERRRVLPVIEAVAGRLRIPISIDTTRAATARACLAAGAEIVNDISALAFDPELAGVAAEARAGLVLMHMRGTPATMQQLAPSDDIFGEIEAALLESMCAAERAGVAPESLVLDPGIGFGKTLEQNVALVGRLDRLARLDRPLLVGASRKSFLGRLTGRDASDRLAASVASATAAVLRGAHVVRVHDVAATVDAVRVADALLRETRQ